MEHPETNHKLSPKELLTFSIDGSQVPKKVGRLSTIPGLDRFKRNHTAEFRRSRFFCCARDETSGAAEGEKKG